MKHRWSSWPGAFCLNCGVEHAFENATGLGWYDLITDKWLSDKHKKLVSLCDNNCLSNMDIESVKKIRTQIKELEKQIK